MIIYRKGFQKKYNDTIAVIYEIVHKPTAFYNIEKVYRECVKPNQLYDRWQLYNDREYLIICGRKEFKIKDGAIEQSYPKFED